MGERGHLSRSFIISRAHVDGPVGGTTISCLCRSPLKGTSACVLAAPLAPSGCPALFQHELSLAKTSEDVIYAVRVCFQPQLRT